MPKVDVNKKRGDPEAQVDLSTFWREVNDIRSLKNLNLTGKWEENFGHTYHRYQDPTNDLIIPLGRLKKGIYASINLSIDLNLLAVGSALSGLGVFRRATLTHLVRTHSPEQLQIVIIDPIRSLGEFDDINHLARPRAVSEPQIQDTLEWLQEEYQRRIELCRAEHKLLHIHNDNAANNFREPKLLIMVTELGDLDIENDEVKKTFAMIMSMARATEMNTILCSQQPNERTFSDLFLNWIYSRIAFKLPYVEESKMLLGKAGAEELLGQGDMIYTNGSDYWRLQGFHVG